MMIEISGFNGALRPGPNVRSGCRMGLALCRLASFIILLLVFGFPAETHARSARPVLRINQIDPSKSPALRVFLTDLDSTGLPITDRKPQTYRLLVDGVPQVGAAKLKRFFQIAEPLTLTLVIQVSPSMRDVFAEVIEAGKKFLSNLPAGSKVGLVAYADVVVSELKPTSIRNAKEGLDALRIREALAVQLPDALRDALEGMENSMLPRKRSIILLSDGLSADLNFTIFSELGVKAQEKGIAINSVGYALLEPNQLRTLDELSKRSGGTFRETRDADSVNRAFNALQEEYRQELVLTYILPNFFNGKLHDFQIETPAGQASNILSLELPKIASKIEKPRSEFGSTWLVILLLVLGQGAIIGLALLYLKWRKRRSFIDLSGQSNWTRDGEDDDDEEEDDEEDEFDNREEDDEEDDDDEIAEPEIEEHQQTNRRTHKRGRRGEKTDELSKYPGKSYHGKSGFSRRSQRSKDMSAKSAMLEHGVSLNLEEIIPSVEEVEALLQQGIKPRRTPMMDQANSLAKPAAPSASESLPLSANRPFAPSSELPELAAPSSINQLAESPWNEAKSTGDVPFRLPLPDPEDIFKPAEDASKGDSLAHGLAGRKGKPSASAEPVLSLPHPEDFMMQVAAHSSSFRKASATSEESNGVVADSSSENDEFFESPLVAGSGIPLPHGKHAPVPFLAAPDLGAQPGRFLDRQTRVLSGDSLNVVESIGWIMEINPRSHRTYVLHPGFSFGVDSKCDILLKDDGTYTGEAVILLDARGYRLETMDALGEKRIRLLKDDDHFYIGDREFIYKIAQRNPSPPIPAIRMEVLDGMDQGRKIPLEERTVYTIGSHSQCDLIVRGEGVNKYHAVVVRKDRICLVSDLGSPEGLRFRGEQVGCKSLKPGDEISLGSVRLVYIFEEWNDAHDARDDSLSHTIEASKNRIVRGRGY